MRILSAAMTLSVMVVEVQEHQVLAEGKLFIQAESSAIVTGYFEALNPPINKGNLTKVNGRPPRLHTGRFGSHLGFRKFCNPS